ncbi:MAG: diphthine synthase [Candidatus Aenigmarchaeota archaeon]|nr:diphthine synthase [Candidatus Aenigmarchaeota archaeon]
MLYLIGLGLNDESDLSLKALEAVKKCDIVFAETYTSFWHGSFAALEKMAGKKIHHLTREQVESDLIVREAKTKTVALLIPGDPLAATTHIQLMIDAKKSGIPFTVIHSSSIYSSIAESGLQIYKFGRATTLVSPEKGFDPFSPYAIIASNKKNGLHSLILLCVKGTGEHMKIRDGVELLLRMEVKKKEKIISNDTKMVACCKLGAPDQEIFYSSAPELIKKDPAGVPAVLLLPADLNFKEEEALEMYSC